MQTPEEIVTWFEAAREELENLPGDDPRVAELKHRINETRAAVENHPVEEQTWAWLLSVECPFILRAIKTLKEMAHTASKAALDNERGHATPSQSFENGF